jgi:HSP20 family protein
VPINPLKKEKAMNLTNYKPQTPDVFDQIFSNDVFTWQPAIDVIEEKDRFTLRADLPGIKKEDIKVSVEDGVLTIEGERKTEKEEQGKQLHRIERMYGRFVRVLNLGNAVEYNKIDAFYKDGVLEVTVPKSEAAKPKLIDIRVE